MAMFVHMSDDRELDIVAGGGNFGQTAFWIRTHDKASVAEIRDVAYRPFPDDEQFVHVLTIPDRNYRSCHVSELELDADAESFLRARLDKHFVRECGRRMTRDEVEEIIEDEERFKVKTEDGRRASLGYLTRDTEYQWFCQRAQAEAARRRGCLAAVSRDEQGKVWTIDWNGREDEIKIMTRLVWRYGDLPELDWDDEQVPFIQTA